jgi:hypothetical protein
MKPFERIQLVKVQSGKSRSGQAGSESCLSSGDRRERSVDSEEMGREDSAPKSMTLRKPRLLKSAEGNILWTDRLGSEEPPESLALGTFSKGFSRNLGKPLSLLG